MSEFEQQVDAAILALKAVTSGRWGVWPFSAEVTAAAYRRLREQWEGCGHEKTPAHSRG